MYIHILDFINKLNNKTINAMWIKMWLFGKLCKAADAIDKDKVGSKMKGFLKGRIEVDRRRYDETGKELMNETENALNKTFEGDMK